MGLRRIAIVGAGGMATGGGFGDSVDQSHGTTCSNLWGMS